MLLLLLVLAAAAAWLCSTCSCAGLGLLSSAGLVKAWESLCVVQVLLLLPAAPCSCCFAVNASCCSCCAEGALAGSAPLCVLGLGWRLHMQAAENACTGQHSQETEGQQWLALRGLCGSCETSPCEGARRVRVALCWSFQGVREGSRARGCFGEAGGARIQLAACASPWSFPGSQWLQNGLLCASNRFCAAVRKVLSVCVFLLS